MSLMQVEPQDSVSVCAPSEVGLRLRKPTWWSLHESWPCIASTPQGVEDETLKNHYFWSPKTENAPFFDQIDRLCCWWYQQPFAEAKSSKFLQPLNLSFAYGCCCSCQCKFLGCIDFLFCRSQASRAGRQKSGGENWWFSWMLAICSWENSMWDMDMMQKRFSIQIYHQELSPLLFR